MLNQVLVGPSGLRSSEIALGSMTFGEPGEWGCDEEEAQAILAAFAEAGGTTIDTAPNYAGGESERIIGKFAKTRRGELVLSTKYTASSTRHPLAGGNSRRAMVQSVEESLRRLQTDRIDLFWLHYWDHTTPLDEILRAVDDLVSAGKILYFGLSDIPAWLASRAVTIAEQQRRAPVVALQLEYNVASRGVERDLLPMADTLGLTTFCWGPLAAGALAGSNNPKRLAGKKLPPDKERVRSAIENIAAEANTSPRRLALRWLMQSQTRRVPIIGARTAKQLQETLTDAVQELDEDTFARIDGMAAAEPLFPSPLIGSSYLRKFALGTPERFADEFPPRA